MSYEFAIFLSQSAEGVQVCIFMLCLFGAAFSGAASAIAINESKYQLSIATLLPMIAAIGMGLLVIAAGNHEMRKPVINAAYGRIEVKKCH